MIVGGNERVGIDEIVAVDTREASVGRTALLVGGLGYGLAYLIAIAIAQINSVQCILLFVNRRQHMNSKKILKKVCDGLDDWTEDDLRALFKELIEEELGEEIEFTLDEGIYDND